MYEEIKELYEYCIKRGVPARLENMYDGYAVRFPNGSDFAQHGGTYGAAAGCVEPAIGCNADYSAVTLTAAKRLIRTRFKVRKDESNV